MLRHIFNSLTLASSRARACFSRRAGTNSRGKLRSPHRQTVSMPDDPVSKE